MAANVPAPPHPNGGRAAEVAQASEQRDGVVRGVPVDVVVEVDDHVQPGRGPLPAPVGPAVEGRGRVPAGVQLGVAVQPHVDQVGGDLERLGPAAGGVGDHHADAVRPEQVVGLRRGEGRVPELQRVPQRPLLLGHGQHPVPADLVVVPARQEGGLPRGAGQQREEVVDHLAVERHPLGQLPEERPQLAPELGDPRREEVAERRSRRQQLLHVGDEPAALHGKDEILGRGVVPLRVRLRRLQRIERAVDLDRRHLAGRVLEFALLSEPLGVEDAAPGCVDPAGDPDPHRAPDSCHVHILPNRAV